MIRPATRADVAEIVRLLAEDSFGKQRECYQLPLPQRYLDAFTAIEHDPRSHLIVAEQDGQVVGTLQLTFLPSLTYQGGTRAQIEAVHVDARYRNQGIGRMMMEWAIDRARQERCCLVQLTSNAERVDAHRFYQRLGFVPSHLGMKLIF